MHPTRFRLRRFSAGLAALIVAALLVAFAGPNGRTPLPGAVLTSGAGFTLGGTVTGLTPGVASTLVISVGNPNSVPITVTSVSVSVTSVTTGCPVSNLKLDGTAFSGTPPTGPVTVNGSSTPPLPASVPSPVPAYNGVSHTNGSATVSLPILLIAGAPNACQTTTFNFSYAGLGAYTEPTSTALVSTPNPSSAGQSVTLTASVSGTITPSSANLTPVGSVTFNQCTNATCGTYVALSGAVTVNASGVATYATSTLPFGSDVIFAVFTGTDQTSYATSSSTTITQVVTAGNCESAIPTSGSTVTTITGTYSGNYEVKNGTVLYLNGGTITGSVTVDATGQFTASSGTVKGSVTSTGGPLSLQGTSVGGNISASNAGLALGANSKVSGNVTVTGGIAVCVSGSASGPVTISGNLVVQSLGATSNPVNICNAKLSGGLTYDNNAAPVVIGGSSGCLGNTMAGLQVENNTAKATIGGIGSGYGNTASGAITVSGNKGGGTLTNNSTTASCSLGSDTPPIVGSANTASGKNSCNATA